MLELTEKEWDCFNEYLKDLLKLLDEDDELSVSDSKNSYTREEIINLQNKISNVLQIHS